MKTSTTIVATVVGVLVVATVAAGTFVYSGVYNIGADDHHTRPVQALLQTLRERSIERRAQGIAVPNLDDGQLILKGAGQYAAMCTGCHLAPGMAENEMRPGLYPRPPQLAKFRPDPREAFWVIKHGIKMSAMPAWGGSHDDATIWSMVAFLQKLPGMTPAQYKDIVAKAPPDDDMHMGGDGGHSHGADGGNEQADAPATETPLSLEGMTPNAAPPAEALAKAFQSALQRGDRAGVLALLAPDASISEGGHTQTRDEYASGHLDEDIAFLKIARITPVSLGSMPMGDTAMVGSESDMQATIKGKPMTLRSRELLNLRKDGDSWKIVSVQWQTTPVSEE